MTARRARPFHPPVALLVGVVLLPGFPAPLPAVTGGARLPVVAGQQAVASVNGEPVTLDDVLRRIGSVHSGVAETRVARPDPSALLERIINARLIVQEGTRIGLDDLPETRSRVEALRLGLVKSSLVRRQVGGITAGDPAVAERLYRDAVREVILDSLLFRNEEDAVSFSASVRSGGDFKALADREVAAGRARGGAGAQPMKPSEMRPEVAKLVAAMKPGAVGGPVRLDDGFTIVRLVDIRYPENPEARAQARQDALEVRKQARLEEYMVGLRDRYAIVDRRVLAGLDYESKEPGLEALRRDERVVARVKGGEPVRVKDLTLGVEKKFYHGVEGAAERKRINADLPQILEFILTERAALLEAKRLHLEGTADFKAELREQTEGVLFDVFVKTVIDPEVKLDTAGLKAYYDQHAADYTTPEMMRIESLAFRRPQDARAAIDALRKGADMSWVRSHGDGQVTREDFASLLEFGGGLTTTATFPEGMRKATAGAQPGDVRFYGEPGGPFYVLAVRQVVAAAPRPYESVKNDVATRLFVLERQRRVDAWVARLRAATDVKVFATGQALSELLGLGREGGA